MEVQHEKKASLTTRLALFLSKLPLSAVKVQRTSATQASNDLTEAHRIVVFGRLRICRKDKGHGRVAGGGKNRAASADFDAFPNLEATGIHKQVKQLGFRLDVVAGRHGNEVVAGFNAVAMPCLGAVVDQPTGRLRPSSNVRGEADHQILSRAHRLHERRAFWHRLELFIKKIARLAFGQLTQRKQLWIVRKDEPTEQRRGCGKVYAKSLGEGARAIQAMRRVGQQIQCSGQPQGESFLQVLEGSVQVSIFSGIGSSLCNLMHISMTGLMSYAGSIGLARKVCNAKMQQSAHFTVNIDRGTKLSNVTGYERILSLLIY